MEYGKVIAAKRKQLWWQKQGLQFSATGYGSRIPTGIMIRLEGDRETLWRRVYCIIYSNIGSIYVLKGKQRIFLIGSDVQALLEK